MQLRASNPDLRGAFARFQQARALAGEARSAQFPTVGANASAIRGRESRYAPNTLGAGRTGNDFIADLDVAWQIDLFGRLRNMTAAANARAQASAADLGALNLSLQAQLASDYFTLRGDDATVQLLEDSVKQFDTAWEQTRRRYDTGVSAATDVDQADTLRQNARAQLAATRLDRARMEHAIAVLLGVPPSAFDLPPANLRGEPPAILVGLPSSLLERRPDVAKRRTRRGPRPMPASVWRAPHGFRCSRLQAAAAGFESTGHCQLDRRAGALLVGGTRRPAAAVRPSAVARR